MVLHVIIPAQRLIANDGPVGLDELHQVLEYSKSVEKALSQAFPDRAFIVKVDWTATEGMLKNTEGFSDEELSWIEKVRDSAWKF